MSAHSTVLATKVVPVLKRLVVAVRRRPKAAAAAGRRRRFRSDERGNNALEYAVIVALITLTLIGAITSIGGSIRGLYAREATAVGSL